MGTSRWSQIEDKFQPELYEKIVNALWDQLVIQSQKSDEKILEGFKIIIEILREDLTKYNPDANAEKINDDFTKAIKEKNLSLFKSLFKDLSSEVLIGIAQGEDILKAINPPAENNPSIEGEDIFDLKKDMKEKGISATVSISNHQVSYSVESVDITTNTPLSIHSLGKVFTAMLLMKMIRDGIIIKKDVLEKPIQLDNDVLSQLSDDVRDRLQYATFKQIMTHHSGLGNYLTKQFIMIDKANTQSALIPLVHNSRELLKFSDKHVEKLDNFHYSNLGFLLLGLSIENHYNNYLKKEGKPSVTIDEIMQSFALDEVKMILFSPYIPSEGARFNSENPYLKYLYGSPAGGHWTTSADMQKFAFWIQNECHKDPAFKELIKEHGEEFYDKESDAIIHSGDLPTDSSWFYCSLKNDTSICILSDQGGRTATNLGNSILRQTAWYKPVLENQQEAPPSDYATRLQSSSPAYDLHRSGSPSSDISQNRDETNTAVQKSKKPNHK